MKCLFLKIPCSTLVSFLSIALLYFSCVIPADPMETMLKISLSNDTISPYGSLTLCFSFPLEDSIEPVIAFNPLFHQYYQSLNSKRDTLTIIPAAPFEGDTRYTLHPEIELISKSGVFFSIKDTLQFSTYPLEREPNNSVSSADTLKKSIFGTISALNDTDYFCIGDSSSKKLQFKSSGSRTIFHFSNRSGTISELVTYQDSINVSLPTTLGKPLYLLAYSFRKSSGGFYQIQIVK